MICGYTVRPITENDIKKIVELEKQCFSHPMSEENAKSFLLGGNGIAFVCFETENEENLCAYGGALCVFDEAQVLNIATSPHHRRRGLGRAMTEILVKAAHEKGALTMTLEVRESNVAARNLYESIGFYEIGRIKKYYTLPTEDALVLKLDIEN